MLKRIDIRLTDEESQAVAALLQCRESKTVSDLVLALLREEAARQRIPFPAERSQWGGRRTRAGRPLGAPNKRKTAT
jgi:hypothetical protein